MFETRLKLLKAGIAVSAGAHSPTSHRLVKSWKNKGTIRANSSSIECSFFKGEVSLINNKFNIGLYKIPNLPLVKIGDDIAQLIYCYATQDHFTFKDHDIIVIAHKIVSKAENALIRLSEITPSDRAQELAKKTGRDPRLCQVYLNESKEILGIKGRYIITRHRIGYVGTEAGVDRSNVASSEEEIVALLPRDPDASARRIKSGIEKLCQKEVAVIICDTFGNEFRNISISWAIGIAGIRPLDVLDRVDLYGNRARSSAAQVDEIAAAAGMLMGQADEGTPVVVVRGVKYTVCQNVSIKDILKD